MEDDPYMDDNAFRRSSLNLSDPRAKQPTQPQRESEKRPRTSDEFQLPYTPASRRKHEGTKRDSASSQSSTDRQHQKKRTITITNRILENK